jgi:hypothetical protein
VPSIHDVLGVRVWSANLLHEIKKLLAPVVLLPPKGKNYSFIHIQIGSSSLIASIDVKVLAHYFYFLVVTFW